MKLQSLKFKFMQASNCYRRVLEDAKLLHMLIKQKSFAFQKLGSQYF